MRGAGGRVGRFLGDAALRSRGGDDGARDDRGGGFRFCSRAGAPQRTPRRRRSPRWRRRRELAAPRRETAKISSRAASVRNIGRPTATATVRWEAGARAGAVREVVVPIADDAAHEGEEMEFFEIAACLGDERRDGERPDGRVVGDFHPRRRRTSRVRIRRERPRAQTSTRDVRRRGRRRDVPSRVRRIRRANYERHGVFRRGGEGGGGCDATPRAPPRRLRPHLRRGDRQARLRGGVRAIRTSLRNGDFF